MDETLVDEATLQARIAELGAQISQDYQGKPLHLICILRGGVMFLTDLMRHITVPHTVDFMAVSSYGTARQSTGQVRITLDLKEEIHGLDVLLVEDIVDQRLHDRLCAGAAAHTPPAQPARLHAAG